MRYIIYLIIVLVVLWKGKPYIKGWLINFRNKKNIIPVDSDLVYVPVSSSRIFHFAIEIQEIGGGKAKVSVVKNKNLQD